MNVARERVAALATVTKLHTPTPHIHILQAQVATFHRE